MQLHGTISVIVFLNLVHGPQDPSCYGFKVFDYSSPTEAQLRVAPNRPCMNTSIFIDYVNVEI